MTVFTFILLKRGRSTQAVARMVLREPGIIARMEKISRTEVEDEDEDSDAPDKTIEGDVRSSCSHCNLCIVGSTMAETPLVCVERAAEQLDPKDIEDICGEGQG